VKNGFRWLREYGVALAAFVPPARSAIAAKFLADIPLLRKHTLMTP